jgi:hypothetical protein
MALESLAGVMRAGRVHGTTVTVGFGYDLLEKFQWRRPDRKGGVGLFWMIICVRRANSTEGK